MVEYYTKAYIVFHKSGSTGEPEFNYTFSEARQERGCIMKEKTKSVILIVVIVLLAIWLAVESFLVGILIDWYRKSTYEVIDGDILELQTRVTALENGTTLADELAKLEVNTSESSAQPQE